MITVFFSSLIAIFAMICGKMIEMRAGKNLFWSRLFVYGDKRVHDSRNFIEKKINLYRKIASLFVFEFLPSYTYEKVVKLKDYIYKKYYSSSSALKGNKRMLRTNGSVSSFLKNITKEEQHEGEVEAGQTDSIQGFVGGNRDEEESSSLEIKEGEGDEEKKL